MEPRPAGSGRQLRFGSGLGAPQPFAAGELNPRQAERPALDAGNGERFLEQPGGDPPDVTKLKAPLTAPG